MSFICWEISNLKNILAARSSDVVLGLFEDGWFIFFLSNLFGVTFFLSLTILVVHSFLLVNVPVHRGIRDRAKE